MRVGRVWGCEVNICKSKTEALLPPPEHSHGPAIKRQRDGQSVQPSSLAPPPPAVPQTPTHLTS